jgi:hypothetical protein
MIGTDCTGSSKSSYHTITTRTVPTGQRQTKNTTQKTKKMSNTDPTKNTTQKTKKMSNTDPTNNTTQKTKKMSNTDPPKTQHRKLKR